MAALTRRVEQKIVEAQGHQRPGGFAARHFPLWIFAVSLFGLAVVFDPQAKEAFRIPKELLFRAVGIASFIVVVFRWRGQTVSPRRLSRPMYLSLAMVLWTAVTTLTSSNQLLSFDSLTTVTCAVLFYNAVRLSIQDQPSAFWLDIILPGALINALLVMAQEFKIWQPFDFPPDQPHALTTGLMGNPNDAGMFLLIPALVFAVAAASCRGNRRIIYILSAVILAGGLIACGTRIALIAYVLGLLATAAQWGRTRVILLVPLLVIFVIISAITLRRQERGITALIQAAKNRQYDVLLTQRLPAFLTAMEMAKDHPVTGAGPGTYKWHYLRYRIELAQEYPERLTRGWALNFREAHNDHLQILAEAGLPGYGLFAFAIGLILLGPRRDADPSASLCALFADRFRLPFCVALLVLMLAQFPLQIAAARAVILYVCALVTWRHQ